MADRVYIPGTVDAVMHLETDGTIHVEHVQDVESTLNYAHAARNHRFSGGDEFREEAAIPYVVLMDWAREAGCGIFDDEMSIIMERKLQLPEYAHLLTAPKTRDARVIIKGAR